MALRSGMTFRGDRGRELAVASSKGRPGGQLLAAILGLLIWLGALQAAQVHSVRSGNWSDPSVWSTGTVPGAGDDVVIDTAHTVVYDVASPQALHSIHVRGKLSFSRSVNTELNVGMLIVSPAPSVDLNANCSFNHPAPGYTHRAVLEIGTRDNPIPQNITARIRLVYFQDLDPDCAPAIIAYAGSQMEIHGAPLNRTWLKLSADAPAGATTIQVEEPVNWRIGDRIVVTASRKPDSGKGTFLGSVQPLSEENTVAGISGNTITLSAPLVRFHRGSGPYRVEVANLSRNVVIESADPNGVRGHTMYHRNAIGSISYAEFAHLGKKDRLARYPIHFHRVRATDRGGSVIGASIWDSHNRWITVHGTDYMVIKDCVGYKALGHGFFLEDGTEVFNLFDRNLAIHAYMHQPLPNQALAYDPNDGAGFWWANARNAFINNMAVENDRYGYRYHTHESVVVPVLQPDGSIKQGVQIKNLGTFVFRDNAAHGQIRYGFKGTNSTSPSNEPMFIENFTAWHNRYGLAFGGDNYYIKNVHVAFGPYGLRGLDLTNARVEGLETYRIGKSPLNFKHKVEGLITVENVSIDSTKEHAFKMFAEDTRDAPLEIYIRNYTVSRAVNGTDGAAAHNGTPSSPDITMYLFDWFGPGLAAKVIPANQSRNDGLTYTAMPPHFDATVKVAQTNNPAFPSNPIQPVDDLPPATVILYPAAEQVFPASQQQIVVRGTCVDNSQIASLTVNGVPATSLKDNYREWEAILTNLSPGELTIEARAEDVNGNVELNPHRIKVGIGQPVVTGLDEPPGGQTPRNFALLGNYPNPFNPTTQIKFRVGGENGGPAAVQINIYDVFGRLVRRLVQENLPAGEYTRTWDGRNDFGEAVSSGLYFYELVARPNQGPAFRQTSKMVLLK
ncbi:MAG: hypothetical protein D6715_02350 [Calditrichaeota bacterium]|nr:MAG: hypothetical protein D6715_02350 [Calditrichota bacterium]